MQKKNHMYCYLEYKIMLYLDFLKGNLKMMLLRQYRNLHLIQVFLLIEQLIRIANNNKLNELIYLFMQSSYEILRDLYIRECFNFSSVQCKKIYSL